MTSQMEVTGGKKLNISIGTHLHKRGGNRGFVTSQGGLLSVF